MFCGTCPLLEGELTALYPGEVGLRRAEDPSRGADNPQLTALYPGEVGLRRWAGLNALGESLPLSQRYIQVK